MCSAESWKDILPMDPIDSEKKLREWVDINVDVIQYCKKGRYFQLQCVDFKQEKRELEKKLDECNLYSEGLKRTVILTNNPDERFYKQFIDKKQKTRKFEHDGSVHRGHYIAKMFERYLVSKTTIGSKSQEVNNFFGKGNENNIYYQSAQSNCNTFKDNNGGVRGQLFFEQKIQNFLTKNEKEGTVLFEIEDYRKEGTEISPGRRLLVIYLENGEVSSEQMDHVFIPNLYEGDVDIPEPDDDNE